MTMNPYGALGWLAFVCLVGGAVACSGDDFTSSGTSGGSAGADAGGGNGGTAGSGGTAGGGGTATGGSSGASGSAGDGGTGASGGTGGSSGTGGSAGAGGGTTCTDGSCADDEYCHSDGSCKKCGDLSEFEFHAPEALSILNAAHTTDLGAPRFVDYPAELIYTVDLPQNERKIVITQDFTMNAGVALPDPIDGDGAESLPLLSLPPSDGPLKDMALFFDRSKSLQRFLYGAIYDGTSMTFTSAPALGAPFNDAAASWSMAFAPAAQRAWWMTTRDGGLNPRLYTANTTVSPAPLAKAVPLTDHNNCQIEGIYAYDLAPWVSLDGKLLMFSALESFPSCTKGNNVDIYATGLKADGQVTGNAFPIGVNLQNVTDTAASMSWEMCWIYFASRRNGATKQELYRARRK